MMFTSMRQTAVFAIIVVGFSFSSSTAFADPREGICSGTLTTDGYDYSLDGSYAGKPLYCQFNTASADEKKVLSVCRLGSICTVKGTIDEIGDLGTDLIVENITSVKPF